jgi:hypothetical protein
MAARGWTPEQDAELFLRRRARDMAETSRQDEGLVAASEDLLLAAEAHVIATANLLEAAADWIRDRELPPVVVPDVKD